MTTESEPENPDAKVPRKRRFTAETKRPIERKAAAIIELDPNGFISSWSPEAELMYGYERDEIIGKHFASLYCDGELEQGRATHELMAAEKRQAYCVFGWQRRKNGQQFWTYSESSKTSDGFELLVTETPSVEE